MPPKPSKRARSTQDESPTSIKSPTSMNATPALLARFRRIEPPPKKHCPDESDAMVTVLVGKHKASFQVSKAALCQTSDFFKAMLEGEWVERENKLVTLEEDEPGVFGIYVNWLRGKRLDGDSVEDAYIPATNLRGIFDLYLFADKYQIVNCKLHCSGFVYDHFDGIAEVFLSDLEVLTDLSVSDPMYQVMIDWCMVKCDKLDELIDEAPRFAKTLLKAHNAAFKQQAWTLPTKATYLAPLLAAKKPSFARSRSCRTTGMETSARIILPGRDLGRPSTDPSTEDTGPSSFSDPSDPVARTGGEAFATARTEVLDISADADATRSLARFDRWFWGRAPRRTPAAVQQGQPAGQTVTAGPANVPIMGALDNIRQSALLVNQQLAMARHQLNAMPAVSGQPLTYHFQPFTSTPRFRMFRPSEGVVRQGLRLVEEALAKRSRADRASRHQRNSIDNEPPDVDN